MFVMTLAGTRQWGIKRAIKHAKEQQNRHTPTDEKKIDTPKCPLRIMLFEHDMVSITWHTKNTPPKQPFWHMYLVVPCAHGIQKNEFSTLKIGGGGSKNQKANSIHPHLCVAIYTF